MIEVRVKKKPTSPKTIPWEPYKGATSANTRSSVPLALPPLIPYRIGSPRKLKGSQSTSALHPKPSAFTEQKQVTDDVTSETKTNIQTCVDNKCSKNVHIVQNGCDESQAVQHLRNELEAERQITAELKKLLVASMGDDLSCHIHALSEDKVRLASKMNTFVKQCSADHDRAENFEIMADMWRCKFLAMSVRTDELMAQRAHLITHLKKERQAFQDVMTAVQLLPPSTIPVTVLSNAQSVLSVDIAEFCERSPCDEKVQKPLPVTSNLTVSCCKNCATHEIKLL